jgi:hypothetical protein
MPSGYSLRIPLSGIDGPYFIVPNSERARVTDNNICLRSSETTFINISQLENHTYFDVIVILRLAQA